MEKRKESYRMYDRRMDSNKKNEKSPEEDKNNKHSSIIGVILCLAVLFLSAAIGELIEKMYTLTGSLWFCLAGICYYDIIFLLGFVMVFLSVALPNKKERKDAKEMEKYKALYRKVLKIAIPVYLVFLVISNIMSLPGKYYVVGKDDKTPSKIAYKIAIVKDALLQDTKTVEISDEQFHVDTSSYSSNMSGGKVCYVSYTAEDTHWTSILYDATLYNFYTALEEASYYETEDPLLKHGDRIDEEIYTVEYYPNSGIVKMVNGCSPYDKDGLERYLQDRTRELKQIAEQNAK